MTVIDFRFMFERVRSDAEFGEAELMWRCMECGEMGRIEDGLPDECPNCGDSREALMYWTEDWTGLVWAVTMRTDRPPSPPP
uniref:DUF7130 family rubredoxin-like protein n=1 Tax=Halalkalicoccus salilacus TaxID=3117459 RepID=UPI00300EA125